MPQGPRLLIAACALVGCTGTLEPASVASAEVDMPGGGPAIEHAGDGTGTHAPEDKGGRGGVDTRTPQPSSALDSGVIRADASSDVEAAATILKHDVTFYGWTDNTPPSDAISHSVLHSTAGGVGTYADPITFATAPSEWPPGTILYVPFLQKYVIMEDTCVACAKDWKTGIHHIDIWMKSDGGNASSLLSCEEAWTRSGADVEISPPPDRLVDARPMFDPATGTCWKGP